MNALRTTVPALITILLSALTPVVTAAPAVGGSRTDNGDGSVTVANADSAVVVLAMGTNYAADYPTYRGADPHQRVQSTVDAAVAKGWDGLLSAHESDYRGLFERVRLDLGQQVPTIPTDDLLAGYANAAPATKRALEVLYFQYGRYLLISSSRAGSLPADFQGGGMTPRHRPGPLTTI